MTTLEKNPNTDYYFLMNSFTTADIESIKNDLKLYYENYYFIYVVDTYDIVENYLPYTEIELFSRKDRNYQVQKFICYDYFFGRLNNTTTVLLNEYKIELLAAKNKLNRHLRDAKTVINNLETLKKETNDFIENPARTEEFFRKHFEVILLLLILNDKTQSILEEFFSFIRTRLMVSEVKVRDERDSELIDSIFAASSYTKFSIDLFEKYIEQNKTQLLSINAPTERHIFLENTFRDIQVVERVLKINQTLKEKDLKYHVIYLSSAHKTVEIFRVLNSLLGVNLSHTDSTNRMFHRNIYQYFLYDKIKSEFENDHDQAFEILESLKEILAKKETEPPHKFTDNKFANLVEKLFEEKSTTIDNHFYLSVYEKYKDTFDKMAESKNKIRTPLNSQEVVKIISEIDRNKKQYKSSLFNLDFTLSQLNQTYEIYDTFLGLDEYEPEYRFGLDIVRNPYQHLPYLPLISEKFTSPLKAKLYAFLNRSIELGTGNKHNLKQALQAVVDELTKLNTTEIYSKYLKSVVLTYLNLVAQRKTKHDMVNTDNALEDGLLADFEKQYKLIKYQFSKIDYKKITENNRIEFKEEHNELLIEISYILIWLYRRTNRDDEGIQRATEIFRNDSDDPRIDQGLALCHISKTYKLIKLSLRVHSDQIKKHCDLAFHFLRLAKEKYKLLINDHLNTDNEQLILKNYIAILHSMADMAIRKYELETKKDSTLIEAARQYIDEIKSLFDTIGLIYDKQATYSATEMEIEYYEALNYYNAGAKSKAHQKIVNASLRKQTLNNLNFPSNLLDEYFVRNESRINQLANEIFSSLK